VKKLPPRQLISSHIWPSKVKQELKFHDTISMLDPEPYPDPNSEFMDLDPAQGGNLITDLPDPNQIP
jgi:hypothetical protein